MGCSTSAIVPLDSDIDENCPVKVHVNPSTPDQVNGKTNGKNDHAKNELIPNGRQNNSTNMPALAFEVPAFDDEEKSLIKKYPPKRLRRFDDQSGETGDLSHESIDEKQKEAEIRRREILTQRIMSAKRGNGQRILNPVNFPIKESEETWEKNM